MASKSTVFVRIKPFNPRNQRVRTYSVFGLKFVEGRWFEVSREMTKSVGGVMKTVDIAKYLRTAKNEHAVDSDFIFDVVDSKAEADALLKREAELAAEQSPTSMAVDFTGQDEEPAAPVAKRRPGRPRKSDVTPALAPASE